MTTLEPPIGQPVRSVFGIPTPTDAVVLASSRQVQEQIKRLAQEIIPWITDSAHSGPVILVALLEGGRFYVDRLNNEFKRCGIESLPRVDLKVSTRDLNGNRLPVPTIDGDLDALRGQRILVGDDILDSGDTLALVQKHLSPICSEMKSTVLVQKDPEDLNVAAFGRPSADYVGLRFQDSRWFSGLGMDMPGDHAGEARRAPFLIAYPPVV